MGVGSIFFDFSFPLVGTTLPLQGTKRKNIPTMKQTIFPIFLAAGLLLLANPGEAQAYKTAIGARLGAPLAASLKHFLTDDQALEVYAGMSWYSSDSWTSISGAYQIHRPLEIEGIENLRWYFGGGATALFWNFDALLGDRYPTMSIGLQAYLGAEYVIPNYPISMTVDWVPTFLFNGYRSGFRAGYGSVGVRYILTPKP